MAKIKTMRVAAVNSQTGERVDYDVPIKVSACDGMFTAELPDDFKKALENVTTEIPTKRDGYKTLEELETRLKALAHILVETKILEDEVVIKYRLNTKAEYTKDAAGNFFPTNWLAGIENATCLNECHGTEELTSSHCDYYGLQVYCGVFRKRTYQFTSAKQTTKYEPVEYGAFPEGSNLEWLRHIKCNSLGNSWYRKSDYDELPELPATEQNALFFRNLYCAIFKLNEMIKPLTDSDVLLNAISSGNIPMLNA